MNKIIICLIIPALLFGLSSCVKERDCNAGPNISDLDQEQLREDIEGIEKYLEENNIPYETDASGIRFSIIERGTGVPPNYCSSVIVDYEGRVLGETEIFDANNPNAARPFQVEVNGNIILGWKFALVRMNRNADYRVFIPSQLAYGEEGRLASDSTYIIPPNANLEFRIRLNNY
ncbi:hypothetical protein GCM10011506_41280 [Marivirga lumbricoides]|uniref:Peptidyl-prolyl cis-trans isomerase n=1 Tax=Marivirga lumbricoides TaxID=1046115 RepID=A0ABQ1N8V9_9BACT|nr:hypothetical protein GCM10011506_41280 [Marivirga lumbricoides]